MSAYICPKTHIVYLVTAAVALDPHCIASDAAGMARAATVLWQANFRGVRQRYPNDYPSGGEGVYHVTAADIILEQGKPTKKVDAVQLLKSARCYEYQTSDDSAYESSEAAAIMECIIDRAISHLPGYESAVWGAPEG